MKLQRIVDKHLEWWFFVFILWTIEIFDNHINLISLDMYVSIERYHIIQEPIDNEFDLCDTLYLSKLNVDFSRDIVQ